MLLKALTDENLISKTEMLVREERELLAKLLHHFREIERRRLFSAYGYKSLFDIAVRHFLYSQDQAYRRIAAMKLLREIPEIEEQITSGEISLSHINVAQTLFRAEKKSGVEYSREDKLNVIAKISSQSIREAEKITMSLATSPYVAKPDRIELATPQHVEIKFLASKNLEEKIAKLKGLLAHHNPNIDLGELFEKLCDLGLEQLDPSKKISKVRIVKSRKMSQAQIYRDVYGKAGNRCEICESAHALEIDHIKPRALGGDSSVENLRLLCRNCNQRAAIEKLGQEKMDRFLQK